MEARWQVLRGVIRVEAEGLTFDADATGRHGAQWVPDGRTLPPHGLALSNRRLASGVLKAEVQFPTLDTGEFGSVAQVLFNYDPQKSTYFSAGLGGARSQFSIYERSEDGFFPIAKAGLQGNLKENMPYRLKIHIEGSQVDLSVDGITVLAGTLPRPVSTRATGFWCQSSGDVVLREFEASPQQPVAFVVMQFSEPFNQLYEEVIKPVCAELNVRANRADDRYGPGLIIQDIEEQIDEAGLVVAEITPSAQHRNSANPNVYYEVGYAHARKKPTILICRKDYELPFDVSGYRTVFYEDTIAGKNAIEEALRRHMLAILGDTSDEAA